MLDKAAKEAGRAPWRERANAGTCPHCGRPWGGIRFGIRFGATAVSIIDPIVRAGDDGISPEALFRIVYYDRPAKRSALKNYIHFINDLIRESGKHISGDGGVYRITEYKPRGSA
jgi:hypothetical protein